MSSYVIRVWDCRAVVSRRVDAGPNAWTYEPVANWQDLEAEAIEAVEAQGGAVNMSANYPCTPGLVERIVKAP